jgi:DMSO reductase anchor subunit
MHAAQLWWFLPLGYLVTVAIETPVLLYALSARHPARRRLLSGLWLTACTYPIVVLVLPLVFGNSSRLAYLATAETFAPLAECALFRAAFGAGDEPGRAPLWRDFAAITAANLLSFALGELLNLYGWFGVIG